MKACSNVVCTVMKDMVKIRNENDKLKREMEQMKKEDDKGKEAGVYENNENAKTWATNHVMVDEKTIEKLEHVVSCRIIKMSCIRKGVEERSIEEKDRDG